MEKCGNEMLIHLEAVCLHGTNFISIITSNGCVFRPGALQHCPG